MPSDAPTPNWLWVQQAERVGAALVAELISVLEDRGDRSLATLLRNNMHQGRLRCPDALAMVNRDGIQPVVAEMIGYMDAHVWTQAEGDVTDAAQRFEEGADYIRSLVAIWVVIKRITDVITAPQGYKLLPLGMMIGGALTRLAERLGIDPLPPETFLSLGNAFEAIVASPPSHQK